MALTLQTNFTSLESISFLNKSSRRLENALTKVSSGQRINSVRDNASAYAISETMRVQLRGLNSSEQNVQTGLSILKTAESGVQKIIDILGETKNLAINAANDSNTDEDRQTIQKELAQRLASINDVVRSTKFNGNYLIDGTYGEKKILDTETISLSKSNVQTIELLPNAVYEKEVYIDGKRVVIGENSVKELTRNFTALNSNTTPVTATSLKSGTNPQMDCDIGFRGNYSSGWKWANDYRDKVLTPSGGTYSSSYASSISETGVVIDFGSAKLENGSAVNSIDAFHNQGFSILCGACGQYINITFDKTMNIGSGTLKTYEDNSDKKDYTVGINGATSQADLARAIFEGIYASSGRSTGYDVYATNNGNREIVCVSIDSNHNLRIAKNPDNPSGYIFLKQYSPAMLFIDSGTVLAMGGQSSNDNLPQDTITQTADANNPQIEEIRVDAKTTAQVWEDEEFDTRTSSRMVGNPLIIQDGTQEGEYQEFLISDMRTKALTAGQIFGDDGEFLNYSDRVMYESLNGNADKQAAWMETLGAAENKTLDDISIANSKDIDVALRVLEGAFGLALNNATRLGTYIQQLELSKSNIFTIEENITAADSKLRDADLAKEMISYTKATVMSQGAQMMLSQANQSSAAVLTLLR